MNESVVFFCFQYVLVNWIYKSQVALLEQINVLRHQVFVALNSHKSSLFLCDLVIHFLDVRFLFQYAVRLGLRGCHSNVRLGRSRSARLITKSVYTGVSEWHICISESPKQTSIQRFAFSTRLKMWSPPWICSGRLYFQVPSSYLHRTNIRLFFFLGPGFLTKFCPKVSSLFSVNPWCMFQRILWREMERATNMVCPFLNVGGTVASWLVCSTPDQAVRLRAGGNPATD